MTDSDSGVARGEIEPGNEPEDENDEERGIPLWSFRLGFGPFAPRRPNDANYSAYMRVKTAPPVGCTFREDYGFARLECRWPGPDRLAAVGRLVREIRTVHGLVGTDDLGIERLGEWAPDDREWAECTVGQLLLMGTGRAEQLGYGVEEVVAFVRDAMAPPPTPRQAARPLPEDDDPDEDDPEEAEADEDDAEPSSAVASAAGSTAGTEAAPDAEANGGTPA